MRPPEEEGEPASSGLGNKLVPIAQPARSKLLGVGAVVLDATAGGRCDSLYQWLWVHILLPTLAFRGALFTEPTGRELPLPKYILHDRSHGCQSKTQNQTAIGVLASQRARSFE